MPSVLFDHYSWLRQFIATQFHTYTFLRKYNINKLSFIKYNYW
jgi:hypothetical protein